MHPLVAEFRALRADRKAATDSGADARKLELLKALDDDANESEVSTLLLEVLRDTAESIPVRAEAIEVVGLYIDETSPLWQELFRAVLRIHGDAHETEGVRQAVEPYVAFLRQTLEG